MKSITYCVIIAVLALCSCSPAKNVPDGHYLLCGYNINADTKDIDVTYFEDFVRQQPNSGLRLAIYNIAGSDTSRWLNRTLRKIGQAPVIYSPTQTRLSAIQIERELNNQGYLRAKVDTLLKAKDKKMSVKYGIHNNGIYTIRDYQYTIADTNIAKSLAPTRRFTGMQKGAPFNQTNLVSHLEQLTSFLRNTGYYNFTKEYLYFRTDTTLNTHQADLYLSLHPAKDNTSFKKYRMRDVYILSGYDPTVRSNERIFANPDTVTYKGVKMIYGSNNFLRESALYRNNYIRPGRFYSDRAYSRTTESFNGIGVIKQTSVSFSPVEGHPNDSIQYLDAQITLAPSNIHYLQTEIQGTNSAGDLGVAPSISYQHRNLFNGAEIFKLKLRGAYEFISGSSGQELSGKHFYEYGIETSLAFPQFIFPWLKRTWREQPSASTQVSVGFNAQNRQEYTRQFFNAALTYRWASSRNRFTHALSLWNINYVRMPWISDYFRENYLESSDVSYAMIRESYKDQLISSTTYGLTYTNTAMYGRVPKEQITIRANFDLSGWLPRLATSLFKARQDTLGHKQIVGIAYAEYIKGDVSFAQTHRLSAKNSLAYHIGVGAATPFGNSDVLPFETRYFSGGANSVRGWNTRDLGPGTTPDSIRNFVTRVGDIKLDMSVEYRHKISSLFELAGFVDAGNVWTIRDYDAQPGGKFSFSKFYKEIALAYGFGIRLDLDFLLLRLDFGARAYDPGRAEGDRWVIFRPSFDNMAWHFGIGYPF